MIYLPVNGRFCLLPRNWFSIITSCDSQQCFFIEISLNLSLLFVYSRNDAFLRQWSGQSIYLWAYGLLTTDICFRGNFHICCAFVFHSVSFCPISFWFERKHCNFLLTYKIISCEMFNIMIFFFLKKKKTVNSFILVQMCMLRWRKNFKTFYFDWNLSKNSRRNENGHTKKKRSYDTVLWITHKFTQAKDIWLWPDISFILSNLCGLHSTHSELVTENVYTHFLAEMNMTNKRQ